MSRMKIFDALQERWSHLNDREKFLVSSAGALIALALIWWLLISPAWNVYRQAPSMRDGLQRQLQTMKQMQQEVQNLRSRGSAVRNIDTDYKTLQSLTDQMLGKSADLHPAANVCNVTLHAVNANAFAQWLAAIRMDAHAIPAQMHLSREGGTGNGAGAGAGTAWSGTLQLKMAGS